jgi:hypothetical protein
MYMFMYIYIYHLHVLEKLADKNAYAMSLFDDILMIPK